MSIVWGQCQRHQSRTTSHHSDISRGNGPRCKRTDRWVLLSVMLLPSHAVNIQTCTKPVMLLPNHAVNIQNCTLSVMLLPRQAVTYQTLPVWLCNAECLVSRTSRSQTQSPYPHSCSYPWLIISRLSYQCSYPKLQSKAHIHSGSYQQLIISPAAHINIQASEMLHHFHVLHLFLPYPSVKSSSPSSSWLSSSIATPCPYTRLPSLSLSSSSSSSSSWLSS